MSNLPVFTIDKMVPAYCRHLNITGNRFKLLGNSGNNTVGGHLISKTELMTDGLYPIIGAELTMSVPINHHTAIDQQIAAYALRVVVLGIINNISTIRQQGHREFVINLHPRCSAMVGHSEYFATANYVVNVDKCYIEVFANGTLPCKSAPPPPPPPAFLIEDSINSDKKETKMTRPENTDRHNVLVAIHSINHLSMVLEGATTVEGDLSDEDITVLSSRINFVVGMLDDSIRAFNHASTELLKKKQTSTK